MSCQLLAVSFEANDPDRLARFWSQLLGWARTVGATPDGVALVPDDDTGFQLWFQPSGRPKTVKNQAHFDLTSATPDGQRATVATALELGAEHIDVGQRPEEGHVVLADPEGNEFCVIAAGNQFLADCGFVGALACDGSQAVGYFWAEALRWPLVWDQNLETAIRSPHGGPKLTWGGEAFAADPDASRLRLHVAPAPGSDAHAEVERLLRLGATRRDGGSDGSDGQVALADPDGNPFVVWMATAPAARL